MSLSSVFSYLLAEGAYQGSEASSTAMSVVSFVLIAIMAVAALAAIILVLLQPGNSDGIEALGGSSETFYGKNKGRSIESKLKMWTYICLGVLGVLAIVFFIVQIPALWGLEFSTT